MVITGMGPRSAGLCPARILATARDRSRVPRRQSAVRLSSRAESRDLSLVPQAGRWDGAEIPRPAFAQGSGEAARLGMTAMQNQGVLYDFATKPKSSRSTLSLNDPDEESRAPSCEDLNRIPCRQNPDAYSAKSPIAGKKSRRMTSLILVPFLADPVSFPTPISKILNFPLHQCRLLYCLD